VCKRQLSSHIKGSIVFTLASRSSSITHTHTITYAVPLSASNQYSATLKHAITNCLYYRQLDRRSFADLKKTTRKTADGTWGPPNSSALGDVVIKVPEAVEGLRVG
jgi:hypothetical protein